MKCNSISTTTIKTTTLELVYTVCTVKNIPLFRKERYV